MESAQSPERLEVDLPAEPASVARGRRAARSFVQGRVADVDAVIIVVGELLTNAVRHGYRRGGRGWMTLELGQSRDALTVSVADDGVGMRPDLGGSGLGLSLAIAAALAERLEIETSDEGGTLVRARFADA
jgi:two-component sensor histidine kinase